MVFLSSDLPLIHLPPLSAPSFLLHLVGFPAALTSPLPPQSSKMGTLRFALALPCLDFESSDLCPLREHSELFTQAVPNYLSPHIHHHVTVQGLLPCVILSHLHHTVILKTLEQMPNRVCGEHVQREEEGDRGSASSSGRNNPHCVMRKGRKRQEEGYETGAFLQSSERPGHS